MSLYQRLLGNPFVYNHVRPLVVGGVDQSATYRALEAGPSDVVLDVGCGTGDALNHFGALKSYYGYDTDPIAIDFARKKFERPNVHFECSRVDEATVQKLAPTRVVLCGLLHHLADDEALDLLRLLARAPSVQRISTLDVLFIPGEHVNNLLAWLDRGKHVRPRDGYRSLVERAGLHVRSESVVRSSAHGRAFYLVFSLEARAS